MNALETIGGNVSSGRTTFLDGAKLRRGASPVRPASSERRDGTIQLRQLLRHDVLSILECDGIVGLLAILLQCPLAGVYLMPQLRKLLGEPVGRFPAGVDSPLQVVIDIRLGKSVQRAWLRTWDREIADEVRRCDSG